MAINPAYTQQQSKPLPIHFGYGNGSGYQALSVTDPANNIYGFYIYGDGECDGLEQLAMSAQQHLLTPTSPALPAGPVGRGKAFVFPNYTHFHAGRWTPIGIYPVTSSTGPDQGFDTYFAQIPTITPPQSFSNISYVAIELPNGDIVSAYPRATAVSTPMAPYGVWRGNRCRYFDASGNVTGYGFTTNPTWHRIEAILRYKLKRQQPQVAGLTAAEKAFFNWPSIVATAERDDFVLANGARRFMGNYSFAAQATLASMLEAMCRSDRSFIDDQDGQIGFFGIDAVDSSFTLKREHLLSPEFLVERKDLTRAANVFIPNYRDLGIQAVIKVSSMVNNNLGATSGANSVPAGAWAAQFTTGGPNPFSALNAFYYGDGSDVRGNSDYGTSGNPGPDDTIVEIFAYGQDFTFTSDGGYIGSQDSRFQQRSPTTVQHRRHQRAAGLVSPGVTALPVTTPVTYDLGNMTYDQANRLMQFERNFTLGNDVDGWKPPLTGSIRVQLEAVDDAGNMFVRLRRNSRFTVPPEVSMEFAGDYQVEDITPVPPSTKTPNGELLVSFRSYNPSAATDTSDPLDDSLRTIQSASLSKLGTSEYLQNVAWVLQSTVAIGYNPVISQLFIAIPDLVLQILGRAATSAYPSAVWNGITNNANVVLYVDDDGVDPPTFGFCEGMLPLVAPPASRYVVWAGYIAASVSGSAVTSSSSAFSTAPTPDTTVYGTDPDWPDDGTSGTAPALLYGGVIPA